MSVGSAIRSLFGEHEYRIAALYRSMFVDIDAYARQIAAWAPRPARILEVGCGEGAVTEKLSELYPRAEIMAIDITPRVGRLYRGNRDHAHFMEITVQEVAARQAESFDLVIVSDVLHHVPDEERAGFLAAVRRTAAPDGAIVIKDWEFSRHPIHWLCHGGDRWLTGDRVRYMRKGEFATLLETSCQGRIDKEVRIRPWNNNVAMLIRA